MMMLDEEQSNGNQWTNSGDGTGSLHGRPTAIPESFGIGKEGKKQIIKIVFEFGFWFLLTILKSFTIFPHPIFRESTHPPTD